MHAAVLTQAQELLKGKAERLTGSRVAVLAALLRAGSALSHTELLASLEDGAMQVDRVTVYRILDWLVEVGLAHKVSGADRLFRYSPMANSNAHGHFHCSDCHKLFCITEKPDYAAKGAKVRQSGKASAKVSDLAATVRALLPKGFVTTDIDLTISGRCAECA
jgi:Fur family transcriptional regulator, ferric uptake regulator